jgi:hypothetical protein
VQVSRAALSYERPINPDALGPRLIELIGAAPLIATPGFTYSRSPDRFQGDERHLARPTSAEAPKSRSIGPEPEKEDPVLTHKET